MSAHPRGFDWTHARTFLAAAEKGSYSAAAHALGLAQPTVGRQLAALEEELGVKLFRREGRAVAPTEAGLALLEHVRAMSDAALRVSRVAAGHSDALEGLVRISASDVVATWLLPPVLAKLRARYPRITLEVVASDAPVDLHRREADLALRSFRPSEPELVARKLRDSAAHLYATPAYLRSLGRPLTLERLAKADFLGFDHTDRYRKGLAALGLHLGPERFPLVTQSMHVQWALALAGAGVVIMMSEVGDAEPRLRRALPKLPGVPLSLWLVSHSEVRTSHRLRVVADALARALARPTGAP